MRIAIANRSPEAVEILRRVITSRQGHEIIWVASTGQEVVEKAALNKPDLIVADLDLPILDGPALTRRVMHENPCAILIVTHKVSENAARVFEAVGQGAVDAESMPVLDSKGNITGAEELLRKIGTVARLLGKEGANGQTDKEFASRPMPPMIAIGSSTGGPKALAHVISLLPEKPGAAIVIIQHVDVQFAKGLAEWLSGQTKLKVRLAKPDLRPEEDVVFVAGTNDHLVLGEDIAFHYVAEPKDNPYRPSVDAFFHSLVKYWPQKGVAVLLTGMGRDGAQGLLELRKTGWHTIAQDEKTSAVYGMPKAAADLNAATEILPIEKIAEAIIKQIKSKEGRLI